MSALVLAPFSEEALARLRTRTDVVYESWLETRRLWDPAELGERLHRDGHDVLVIEADFAFAELFEAAPDLRLLGICRTALNQVDLEAATAHGVAVTHARGRNTQAVVELSLGLMLALARRIPQAHALVSGGGWRDPAFGYRELRGREIAGSTVGVVGFGQIGREVARACAALGATIVAHDPLIDEAKMVAMGARAVTLDELAGVSDFVTLHVPENTSTRRIIGREFFGAVKAGGLLVNTSGGSVIDTDALVAALTAGALGGAALDVFEGHPLPQLSPLLTAPNVILTPHIGGATAETVERHSRIMVDEIERLLDGKPLQHVVNPDYALARAR
jgi:D-3-phosphoglycerate dehydrogenase